MLRTRLLVSTLGLCLGCFPVFANEPQQPPSTIGPPPPAEILPPPPPAQQPLAAELAPVGFVEEFAQRLSITDRRMGAVERADRAALLQFYADRSYEPLWVDESGVNAAALAVAGELASADDWGLNQADFSLPALPSGPGLTRNERADAEIEISLAVLKYARHARGGRADPLALSKNLDRRPRLLDQRLVMDAVAKERSPDAYLRSLHPQHPQFERLRQRYLSLKRDEAAGPLQPVAYTAPKQKSSKQAKGLSQAAMLRTLLVNMEQWRWMPDDLGAFHVWVNIPEYTLRVMRGGEMVHTERVVVGRTNTQTPVFSDEMEHVIFHPFWGVPDSIKKDELLPNLMRGNTDVLSRSNLRIQYRGREIDPRTVDWSKADMRHFHVYQPPGADNVLGVVKFRFPNNHAVYMHDTPAKNLFNAQVRTFSHGCMRVRDPLKLAAVVLGQDRGWTAQQVDATVRKGPKNNWVNLNRKVPVHITYFTAWAEDDGSLSTYADVYGHETRIAMGVTRKTKMIAGATKDKTTQRTVEKNRARAGQVQVAAPRPARRSDRDWAARLFNN